MSVHPQPSCTFYMPQLNHHQQQAPSGLFDNEGASSWLSINFDVQEPMQQHAAPAATIYPPNQYMHDYWPAQQQTMAHHPLLSAEGQADAVSNIRMHCSSSHGMHASKPLYETACGVPMALGMHYATEPCPDWRHAADSIAQGGAGPVPFLPSAAQQPQLDCSAVQQQALPCIPQTQPSNQPTPAMGSPESTMMCGLLSSLQKHLQPTRPGSPDVNPLDTLEEASLPDVTFTTFQDELEFPAGATMPLIKLEPQSPHRHIIPGLPDFLPKEGSASTQGLPQPCFSSLGAMIPATQPEQTNGSMADFGNYGHSRSSYLSPRAGIVPGSSPVVLPLDARPLSSPSPSLLLPHAAGAHLQAPLQELYGASVPPDAGKAIAWQDPTNTCKPHTWAHPRQLRQANTTYKVPAAPQPKKQAASVQEAPAASQQPQLPIAAPGKGSTRSGLYLSCIATGDADHVLMAMAFLEGLADGSGTGTMTAGQSSAAQPMTAKEFINRVQASSTDVPSTSNDDKSRPNQCGTRIVLDLSGTPPPQFLNATCSYAARHIPGAMATGPEHSGTSVAKSVEHGTTASYDDDKPKHQDDRLVPQAVLLGHHAANHGSQILTAATQTAVTSMSPKQQVHCTQHMRLGSLPHTTASPVMTSPAATCPTAALPELPGAATVQVPDPSTSRSSLHNNQPSSQHHPPAASHPPEVAGHVRSGTVQAQAASQASNPPMPPVMVAVQASLKEPYPVSHGASGELACTVPVAKGTPVQGDMASARLCVYDALSGDAAWALDFAGYQAYMTAIQQQCALQLPSSNLQSWHPQSATMPCGDMAFPAEGVSSADPQHGCTTGARSSQQQYIHPQLPQQVTEAVNNPLLQQQQQLGLPDIVPRPPAVPLKLSSAQRCQGAAGVCGTTADCNQWQQLELQPQTLAAEHQPAVLSLRPVALEPDRPGHTAGRPEGSKQHAASKDSDASVVQRKQSTNLESDGCQADDCQTARQAAATQMTAIPSSEAPVPAATAATDAAELSYGQSNNLVSSDAQHGVSSALTAEPFGVGSVLRHGTSVNHAQPAGKFSDGLGELRPPGSAVMLANKSSAAAGTAQSSHSKAAAAAVAAANVASLAATLSSTLEAINTPRYGTLGQPAVISDGSADAQQASATCSTQHHAAITSTPPSAPTAQQVAAAMITDQSLISFAGTASLQGQAIATSNADACQLLPSSAACNQAPRTAAGTTTKPQIQAPQIEPPAAQAVGLHELLSVSLDGCASRAAVEAVGAAGTWSGEQSPDVPVSQGQGAVSTAVHEARGSSADTLSQAASSDAVKAFAQEVTADHDAAATLMRIALGLRPKPERAKNRPMHVGRSRFASTAGHKAAAAAQSVVVNSTLVEINVHANGSERCGKRLKKRAGSTSSAQATSNLSDDQALSNRLLVEERTTAAAVVVQGQHRKPAASHQAAAQFRIACGIARSSLPTHGQYAATAAGPGKRRQHSRLACQDAASTAEDNVPTLESDEAVDAVAIVSCRGTALEKSSQQQQQQQLEQTQTHADQERPDAGCFLEQPQQQGTQESLDMDLLQEQLTASAAANVPSCAARDVQAAHFQAPQLEDLSEPLSQADARSSNPTASAEKGPQGGPDSTVQQQEAEQAPAEDMHKVQSPCKRQRTGASAFTRGQARKNAAAAAAAASAAAPLMRHRLKTATTVATSISSRQSPGKSNSQQEPGSSIEAPVPDASPAAAPAAAELPVAGNNDLQPLLASAPGKADGTADHAPVQQQVAATTAVPSRRRSAPADVSSVPTHPSRPSASAAAAAAALPAARKPPQKRKHSLPAATDLSRPSAPAVAAAAAAATEHKADAQPESNDEDSASSKSESEGDNDSDYSGQRRQSHKRQRSSARPSQVVSKPCGRPGNGSRAESSSGNDSKGRGSSSNGSKAKATTGDDSKDKGCKGGMSKDERLIANRLSAARSYARRKEEMERLAVDNQQAEDAITKLQAKLHRLEQELKLHESLKPLLQQHARGNSFPTSKVTQALALAEQ